MKRSAINRIGNNFIKHPIITMAFVVTGLLLGGVYVYLNPPDYESKAVIEYRQPNVTITQPVLGTHATPATEELTSPGFIGAALEGKANPVSYYIEQDYQKRIATYSFPFIVKHKLLTNKFREQEYRISYFDDETYQLTSWVHGINRTKTGTFGEELIDQDLAITITRKPSIPYFSPPLLTPTSWVFKIQSPAAMAKAQLNQHQGISAEENNGLITLSCRHESAVKAQEITNLIAQHFLETRNQTVENNKTNTTIDEQIAAMSEQLQQTENQIAEYKKQNNIVDLESDTKKSLEIIKDLQLQKSNLELNLIALNNTSKYLRKNRTLNNSNVEYGTITDPVFLNQIEQLKNKYELKESGQGTSTTETEIELIKTSVAERILNTRKKTTIQIQKLEREITSINHQLASYPEKANSLNLLDRKLAIDKKVYDLLVEKRAQAIISGTAIPTSGRILKPASLPKSPAFPTPWSIVIAGMLMGIIFAIPFTALAEKIRANKIRSRQELTTQSRIPFIGTIAQGYGPASLAESFSNLCTKILLRPEVKIITFASTNKGEGKTFIATHFAQAFAAMDKKVLVLDMNTDNPAVAGHFNATSERTLSDVLDGKCDIHDAISITSFPNLDVLECGQLNSGVNSLLASGKRTSIMESLKNHYDIIVTDTPDVGTRIDALALMKLSDLNLFIVRANTTRKQSLLAAEQFHKEYSLPNLHYLLNSSKQADNQQYKSRRSRVRQLKSKNAETERFVPSMLKKIALWFY